MRELRSHPADAMRVSPSTHPVHIGAWGCRTAFGDARTTCAALMAGRRALEPRPVLGRDAGDAVPLALAGGRPWEEAAPPNWARILDDLSSDIPGGPWGAPRRPVFVTSSNFGVGNLYAFQNTQDTAQAQSVSQAVSLIGHTITYVDPSTGAKLSGTVASVQITSSGPTVTVGSATGVTLGSITNVT